MPSVLRIRSYRFFIVSPSVVSLGSRRTTAYSRETREYGREIVVGAGCAGGRWGLPSSGIERNRKVVDPHRERLLEGWHEFFGHGYTGSKGPVGKRQRRSRHRRPGGRPDHH